MSKGHAPRKGRDDKAFAAGWEATFGKKAKSEQALQELTDLSQELGLYDLPQPRTCQHCRYWSEANQPVGFGCCLNEAIGAFHERGESRIWLVPPADFGCLRWEGKV